MNVTQIAAELSELGAQALLTKETLARLAYTGADDSPRVIPVGFWWNGTEIVICTMVGSPKVRAISERPDVALTIDASDTPATAKSVLMRGRASVDIVDGVAEEYLAAAAKSMSGEELAQFEQNVRALYDQMARITIEPTWTKFYDFGAGRLPKSLADLVQSAAG
ncbi:MAG: pyridoxamine 5'-phosphate oxidase family protein [Thermomicrobiales bacterium]|nr:pyridoxamine 5'-phosphate oxidase family protein [Thermomicrobiales bacterium]